MSDPVVHRPSPGGLSCTCGAGAEDFPLCGRWAWVHNQPSELIFYPPEVKLGAFGPYMETEADDVQPIYVNRGG